MTSLSVLFLRLTVQPEVGKERFKKIRKERNDGKK
jgi:hypothetical protein